MNINIVPPQAPAPSKATSEIQGAAGLGDPCVPSVGGPPRGGVPQPIYYVLFTYTYHVLLPASTATFCFVCSTCDAAMDLLSAHATRLAPEQARLAPTAPRCVATGAWGKWLADHDVAVLAAWSHLLLVPTSVLLVQVWMVSLVLFSMLTVAAAIAGNSHDA